MRSIPGLRSISFVSDDRDDTPVLTTPARRDFSVAVTFTDVDPDLVTMLFGPSTPLSLSDPDLYARLTCEGSLA